MDQAFIEDIFHIADEKTFRAAALEVFHYQSNHTPVYRDYLAALRIDPSRITTLEGIPFLPVEFFKSHTVIEEGKTPEVIFESSGTMGVLPSRHSVAEAGLYRKSFTRGFRKFYGDPAKYCILALLPSYMERQGSSLVYMLDHLIRESEHSHSGFYLENLKKLSSILQEQTKDQTPTLLFGVSFALLELAERYPEPLGKSITVMETGGMKGRRREMIRSELHAVLMEAFGNRQIHSEYGMTELLSQAYSAGGGIFRAPPWMRVLIRDPNDPFTLLHSGHSGGINVIDLVNIHSCSFVATADLGKVNEDGSFEVLGRFDHSDIRGCNLLVS